jgi:hypothetical protein
VGYGIVNAYYALFRTKGYGPIISTITVYDDINFTGDVYIQSNRNIFLKDNVSAFVSDGKKIEVSSNLVVNSGAKFTKTSGGTYWSGIDLNFGRTMTVNGDITIENAYCGIDFMSGGTLSTGGNTLTIKNCQIVGLCADSCSPTISNVKCQNTGYYGGLMVCGSTGNAVFNYNTVITSGHGFYIATDASGSVDYCDIDSTNTGSSIETTYGFADLDGYNNICPLYGQYIKAVNNGNVNSIDAEHNWWGTSSPPSSLFSFPLKIDYDPHESSK